MPRGTTQSPYASATGRLLQNAEDALRREALARINPGLIGPGGREPGAPVDTSENSIDMAAIQASWDAIHSREVTSRAPNIPTSPWEGDARTPRTIEDVMNDTMRVQFEGDASLLAEMQVVYDILRSFPEPRYRSEEQQDEISFSLTEHIAMSSTNRRPRRERSRGLF